MYKMAHCGITSYCYAVDDRLLISTDILNQYGGCADMTTDSVETIVHMINVWCEGKISNHVSFKDCPSSYLSMWNSINVITSKKITIAKCNHDKKIYYVNLLSVILTSIKNGSEKLVSDLKSFVNDPKYKIMLFYIYPFSNTVVFGTVKREKLLIILALLTRYCNSMCVEDVDRDKHVIKRILCRYHRCLTPKSFINMLECLSQNLDDVVNCVIEDYTVQWERERSKICVKSELEGTKNKTSEVIIKLRHITNELLNLKGYLHRLSV